jgi:hypothetical protein
MDSVVRLFQEKDVELMHDLHEEVWGQRTIRFFDPDNHLIEIGETLETFVKRIHAEGMTVQQVSEKTSIPLHQVRELIGP